MKILFKTFTPFSIIIKNYWRKNMEIEKKYLTPTIPFDLTNFKKTDIEQCYISTDPVIRLRKTNDKYILTLKGKGEISRQEFEMDITKEQYTKLLKKSETNILSKTRYFIPLENNLTAEIDIYYGNFKGLITTEVEFTSENDANSFSAPEWFGKDISHDNRYKNSNLSKNGLPK